LAELSFQITIASAAWRRPANAEKRTSEIIARTRSSNTLMLLKARWSIRIVKFKRLSPARSRASPMRRLRVGAA